MSLLTLDQPYISEVKVYLPTGARERTYQKLCVINFYTYNYNRFFKVNKLSRKIYEDMSETILNKIYRTGTIAPDRANLCS